MKKLANRMKESAAALKTHVNGKVLASCSLATALMTTGCITAFAAEGDSLPTVAITQDMLKPLVDGVVANITVILPIGLGLFAIFLGIRIIPGFISRFVHM